MATRHEKLTEIVKAGGMDAVLAVDGIVEQVDARAQDEDAYIKGRREKRERRKKNWRSLVAIVEEMGLYVTGWERQWGDEVKIKRGEPDYYDYTYRTITGIRASFTGRGGVVVKANLDDDIDFDRARAAVAAIIPKDHPYYDIAMLFRELLGSHGIKTNVVGTYPTTYGVGIFVFLNSDASRDADTISRVLDKAGISYRNEFSDARWVFRFRISKAKDNLAAIKKMIKEAI